MQDDKKTENNSVDDNKKLFTKDNPHPSGAYWDPSEEKWRGYRPTKGYSPPWNPFTNKERKPRVTINEKKFLMVLSQTGNMQEAFRAVYKIPKHQDKRLENARISSMASHVLTRIRKKAPELVAAFTFDDITPDFIKKEMMKLYSNDHATIPERTRLLELMGKTQAMFTDKVVQDLKVREVVEQVYEESDEDFPKHEDQRLSRLDVEKKIATT